MTLYRLRWKRFVAAAWTGLALASLVPACVDGDDAPAARYPLSGKVVSTDADEQQVVLSHEAIPGFMDAMTMPFRLKDRWALDELQPGDRVEATLVVVGDRSWLEDVVISRPSGTPDTVSDVPDPEPGTPVPNVKLINQDGEPIDLDRYRGKVLVLTFIYSRCPLTEFCPRMSHNFAEIEKALSGDDALYRKTHLLSISFDPEHDTPETLKRYAREEVMASAETFRHWDFASGKPEDVRAIAGFFALDYWPEEEQIVHTLRTAVIGPDGRLFKLYRGNTWRPEQILEDLRRLGGAR